MKNKPTRIVYVAQYTAGDFTVSFTAGDITHKYTEVSESSLDRLNALVYMCPQTVKISVHLSPYITVWIKFPATEEARSHAY
jgi:hypothetical protein